MKETINQMAKAGYETMFGLKWNDLPVNSIDRDMWVRVAKRMIRSVPFPDKLLTVHMELFHTPLKERDT